MIVGVLTTCHAQYTWDRSICIFLFNRKTLQVLLHTLQVLYKYTICDSTNINTIIELVPNRFVVCYSVSVTVLCAGQRHRGTYNETVWNEHDYRVDICRITKSAHREHL